MASSISSTRAAPTEVMREQASPLTPTSIVLRCSRAGHQNHRPSSPAAEGSAKVATMAALPECLLHRGFRCCTTFRSRRNPGLPGHATVCRSPTGPVYRIIQESLANIAKHAPQVESMVALKVYRRREAVRHQRPARRRVRRPLVRWPWTARRCASGPNCSGRNRYRPVRRRVGGARRPSAERRRSPALDVAMRFVTWRTPRSPCCWSTTRIWFAPGCAGSCGARTDSSSWPNAPVVTRFPKRWRHTGQTWW